MTVFETFKERAKDLLAEHEENQADIARLLNVKESTVSRYLSERLPNPEVLATLAKHWGVSVDYLLGLTDVRRAKAQLSFPDDWLVRLEPAIEKAKEKGVSVTAIESAIDFLLRVAEEEKGQG